MLQAQSNVKELIKLGRTKKVPADEDAAIEKEDIKLIGEV